MGQTAVIIVNFNSDDNVLRLISGICSNFHIKKIIVVNNSEYSQKVKKISLVNEKIFVHHNDQNIGFAAGVNIGIKKALQYGVEKILLLNPDLTITNREIDILCDNPADIVGPVLKFQRLGNTIFDYGGKVDWIWGRTFHLEFNSIQKNQFLPKFDYISGACLLIKRAVIEKIGFFDERFFMYFEDVDFCLRAKQAGFSVEINSNIIVEHHILEHRDTKDQLKIDFNVESNEQFIKKWLDWKYKLQSLILLHCKNVLSNYF